MDEDLVTNVVSTSLGMRIVRDTFHSYISLLTHLSGINNTRGWKTYVSQLKHHPEKLGLIRGKYRHRIQLVCKIYIDLRDGQSKIGCHSSSNMQRSLPSARNCRNWKVARSQKDMVVRTVKVSCIKVTGQPAHGKTKLVQKSSVAPRLL